MPVVLVIFVMAILIASFFAFRYFFVRLQYFDNLILFLRHTYMASKPRLTVDLVKFVISPATHFSILKFTCMNIIYRHFIESFVQLWLPNIDGCVKTVDFFSLYPSLCLQYNTDTLYAVYLELLRRSLSNSWIINSLIYLLTIKAAGKLFM